MCASVTEEDARRQNNVPRHVRIKKLSAEAKETNKQTNNNVPLVDKRQEIVRKQCVSLWVFVTIGGTRNGAEDCWAC